MTFKLKYIFLVRYATLSGASDKRDTMLGTAITQSSHSTVVSVCPIILPPLPHPSNPQSAYTVPPSELPHLYTLPNHLSRVRAKATALAEYLNPRNCHFGAPLHLVTRYYGYYNSPWFEEVWLIEFRYEFAITKGVWRGIRSKRRNALFGINE